MLPSANCLTAIIPTGRSSGLQAGKALPESISACQLNAFIDPRPNLAEPLTDNTMFAEPGSTLDANAMTKVHARIAHPAADLIDPDDLGLAKPFNVRVVGGKVGPSIQRMALEKFPFPAKALQMTQAPPFTLLEIMVSRAAQPPIVTERSSSEGLLPWLAGQGSVIDNPDVDKWISTAAEVFLFEEMDCRGIWATVIEMELNIERSLADGRVLTLPDEVLSWVSRGAYVEPGYEVTALFANAAKAANDRRSSESTPTGKGARKGSGTKGSAFSSHSAATDSSAAHTGRPVPYSHRNEKSRSGSHAAAAAPTEQRWISYNRSPNATATSHYEQSPPPHGPSSWSQSWDQWTPDPSANTESSRGERREEQASNQWAPGLRPIDAHGWSSWGSDPSASSSSGLRPPPPPRNSYSWDTPPGLENTANSAHGSQRDWGMHDAGYTNFNWQ